MRIQFKYFWENSSSSEALYDFAYQGSPGVELIRQCWDKNCQLQASKLVNLGVRKARNRARRALIRQGIVK